MSRLHIFKQPFVISTGLAALVHSTWSLATLFNGTEPAISLAWLFWVAPALLIALSVDVGQMATASEIQAGQRSRAKYATFAVFAVATYFLQWYHLAHHIPQMNLAAGVRDEWRGFAQFVADAMVWMVPALLPLSTFLYTFSARSEAKVQLPATVSEVPQVTLQNNLAVQLNVEQAPQQQIEQTVVQKPVRREQKLLAAKPVEVQMGRPFEALCPVCGWSKVYETELGVTRAMAAHKPHCKGALVDEQIFEQVEVQ